jgi:hypothetical protein
MVFQLEAIGPLNPIKHMKKQLKIPYHLAAAGAAVLMITSAMADTDWTGNAGDNDWNDPGNWSSGVPSANNYNVFLDPQANNSFPIIGAGETANVGYPLPSGQYPTVFGPEWGQTLDIYGTLDVSWYMAPVGNTSVINMYAGGAYNGEGIGLGENWWYNGAPGCTWNQYGGTVNINYFFWGGMMNLDGGTFTINDSLGVTADPTVVPDSDRMLDLGGGELIINGDATSLVQGWESRGIVEGYGTLDNVIIDTTSDPGYTVITANPVPEPASMALAGLGGLALLLRRRFVS